jgi:hypothetical protein
MADDILTYPKITHQTAVSPNFAGQSRASSPRIPAVAYCRGTPLRNEIEARGKLDAATDYAAAAIANRHGTGEVAAKIQAHVIVAAA